MKIGAIIQARMKSTRLPGKVLMNLPIHSSKSILERVIDTLNQSTLIDEVIIATSTNNEDDLIESFAKEKNIAYHRGSENNVLQRFCETAKKYNVSIIIRITADNPILDIGVIDATIQHHLINKNHLTYSQDLPLGMNVEIVDATALFEVNDLESLTENDKEHVTYYFKNKNSQYKVGQYCNKVNTKEKYRLTIDYPEDYATLNLITSIEDTINKKGLALINHIENNYSWIFYVNKNAYQKVQFASINDEVKYAVELLKNYDLKNSSLILSNYKKNENV